MALRVAHVLPAGVDPLSGVATVVARLAAELSAQGVEVELWALHALDEAERRGYEAALGRGGVPVVDPGGSGRGRRAALRRRPVDVVHLHSVFSPPNSALAARLRVPYVLTPHGGYAAASLLRSRFRKRAFGLAVEHRTLRRARACVALSRAEQAELHRYDGALREVVVVPNGVDPAPAGLDAERLRTEAGVPADARLVLFVGRLDVFHKGLDHLVAGLADAPAWHLAVVGGDARGGRDELRRLADRVGVADRVHLLGPRTGGALSSAYAGAELLVLPSRWEGLSMALLEALAHGLPALVSPAVEATCGVAAAGAGWVAGPDALGPALQRLAEAPSEDWERAGRAARDLAAAHRWEDVARAHAELYARCAAR